MKKPITRSSPRRSDAATPTQRWLTRGLIGLALAGAAKGIDFQGKPSGKGKAVPEAQQDNAAAAKPQPPELLPILRNAFGRASTKLRESIAAREVRPDSFEAPPRDSGGAGERPVIAAVLPGEHPRAEARATSARATEPSAPVRSPSAPRRTTGPDRPTVPLAPRPAQPSRAETKVVARSAPKSSTSKVAAPRAWPSTAELVAERNQKVNGRRMTAREFAGWKHGEEFLAKADTVAAGMGIHGNELLRLLDFESYLQHQIMNGSTDAVGFIQFVPDTAKELGHTTDQIRRMDPIAQLDVVAEYFKRRHLKKGVHDVGHIYTAVFYPSALKYGPTDVLGRSNGHARRFKGEMSARLIADQNPGLPTNKDGYITAGLLLDFARKTFGEREGAVEPPALMRLVPNS